MNDALFLGSGMNSECFLIKPGHKNFAHPAYYALPIKELSWGEHKDAQSETIFGTEAFLRTK